MELHQSQLPDGLHWGTESDELDELFDVLSNSRRRAVLHYLKQHTGDCPIGISELSRVLAAWEQDIPKEQVAYDDRHSVHTSLQQFHLPKMADSGLVSYNEQETEVGLTPLADGLDVYVETVSAEKTPWSTYFVCLSAAVTATVIATWLGITPFTLLSGIEWSVLAGVTFLVSSITFAYDQHNHRLGTGERPPLLTDG
mgnify:CR=1 FL=1